MNTPLRHIFSLALLGGGVLVAQGSPSKGRIVAPSSASNPNKDEAMTFRVTEEATRKPAPDRELPGNVEPGTQEAAVRQDFLLNEARKTFSGTNVKPTDQTITGFALQPLIDPETGLIKEDAEALRAQIHNRQVIDESMVNGVPLGRRARLAEIAGISQEEAAKLWPWPEDNRPVEVRDLLLAGKYMRKELTQQDAVKGLAPDQEVDRSEIIKNATLTDAEASFAVYAALGLPFPIRVGKVDTAGVTDQGFVIFTPDLLRADPLFDRWEDCQVTYRFMNNNEEVYRDTISVRPFRVIPRPNMPATHLWITCDKDVMLYAPRGVSAAPGTISAARTQIQDEVVQTNSWLRLPTKLYGIRWGLLPTSDELTVNKATRAKLMQVMTDTGLMKSDPKNENEYAAEARQMADYVRSVKMPHAPQKK